MKTKFRPWYSEKSGRWHGKDGRFLAFSDARPRGGVFGPGEADFDFEMLSLPASRSARLERRRSYYYGPRTGETQTKTGLRMVG